LRLRAEGECAESQENCTLRHTYPPHRQSSN
jgi:hypothetical protein